MTLELSLIIILIVILIYIIINKIYSILFQITGLPKNISNFQALSLFTNCGFTTAESETISNHKTRRKIAVACMITGSFFSVIIVSLIVNLISSFSIANAKETYGIILGACGIFILILLFFQIPFIKKFVNNIIQKIVSMIITKKDKDNVITIIDNFGSDSIVEIYIHQLPEFLNNKTIHESKIKSEYNINILSIKRNKRLIDITRNTVISTNDTLLAYGSFQSIKDCFTVQNKTKVELVEVKKKFNEIDLIDNYGSNAMVEVTIQEVPEIIKNKSLIESGLKDKYGINVMIIKREGEVIDVLKDTILQNGDKIVVFGNYQAIKNIFLY